MEETEEITIHGDYDLYRRSAYGFNISIYIYEVKIIAK